MNWMNGMNNRIQKLAEQIFDIIKDDRGRVEYCADSYGIEKFGELIVAECIEIVENAVDHREPASTYADKIRENFGIETVNDTIRRRSTYFGNNP